MFLRRLIRNKLAVLGAVFLLFLVTMALLAPWVATHNPFKLNIKERFQPPSSSHFFGTDGYGRDLFSRVVYGAAIALRVGFLSIIVAITAGILLGLISGYYRASLPLRPNMSLGLTAGHSERRSGDLRRRNESEKRDAGFTSSSP